MNKDRIRKYLIATFATLLMFAAVFVVNELSIEEAYATDLEWSLDLSGAQIKYSDPSSNIDGAKISQIKVEITYEKEGVPSTTIKAESTVNLDADGKSSGSLSGHTFDNDATYKIHLSDPQIKVGDTVYPIADNGFQNIDAEMSTDNDAISYTGSLTITAKAKKIHWTTSQSPTFYYYGGSQSYQGPSATGFKGTISLSGGSPSSPTTNVSDFSTSGYVIDISGGATSAAFEVSDASLSGATCSSIKSDAKNATGTIDSNGISFGMSSVGIITTDTQVTWNAIIASPTVYPSTATISKYKATVFSTSGFSQTFDNLVLSNGKISGTIAVPDDSTQYSIRIDSVTLTSGSVSSLSGNTDSGKTISGGNIAFSIPSLVVTGAYTDVVNAYPRDNFVETENKENASKIVLESLTITRDKARDIIAAQTDETIQAKVIDAISHGEKLSVKVEFSNDSDESKAKDRIESKAKDDGGSIAKYFEISVYLCTGTNGTTKFTTKKITDVGSDNKLSFSFSVPSNISSSSSSGRGKKYYKLYKYHDSAEGISDWKEGTSIDFSERKFSTYGLAYKYENSASPASTPTTSASLPSQGNDPGTAGGTDKSKTPKTGDDFNPRIWIYLLIVCATVASAAWILLQDTREDNEKKQN